MSLILEALRKSEAERRRGRAPDLHAELPPAHARSRRMPPTWLWIAATVVALLLAVLSWIRGRETPGFNASQEQQPAADAAQQARTTANERGPAIAPPPFPRVDRISAPPAQPARTPAPAQSPAPRAEERSDNGIVAPTAPAREPIVAPTAPTSAVAATDVPSPANTPAPASAPPPTQGAIARLSELPPAERKQLPAMKLSMHMWNERPAQRFVIIDNQRYVEGDRIGAAVIRAIDTDGVLLDLNGRPVRLPIR